MRFHARLLQSGKTATGIRVPDDVVAQLGSGKRPPVRVTLRGSTYRTTIAPLGGQFMLPVSAENRRLTGIAAGDEVDVEIELDTEPRAVAVPTDLAEALAADAAAKRAFDGLSYSNQQRIVLAVEQAKTIETRRRRITSSIDSLRAARH
jgi:Domain of unknown function (DUF1905)/Bacteriocin-protection, YdeI or OmpD-Associated